MRWSNAFIPTLRDTPGEASVPSHALMLRAGYVRQLMAGHYSLLPLAQRVRMRVIAIIREEINAIGGQEYLLPSMHPREVWERSGRWSKMDNLFKLQDRKGQEMALGPTHEEIFTTIADELKSYKELPQTWYQFQTKFRDEGRPKSGLLRVREFTMKDSYSFDCDSEGLDRSFDAHRGAYIRIFERLGIRALPVIASSGAMGGDSSVEFMAPTGAGEDDVVTCPKCDYAANAERADSKLAAIDDAPSGELERFDTPGVATIAQLEAFPGGVKADSQIKTLVHVVNGEIVLVLLRGDHELVEQKLFDALGVSSTRPAHIEEIKASLGASPGSLGAVGAKNFRVVADFALQGRRSMATGANEDGVHVRKVDVERDIEVGQWANLRRVMPGEACVNCGTALEVIRAAEVGHIFKLGTVYSGPFGVSVLGPDGEQVTPEMGCYGIGVERAMAVAIEQNHDDKGIVWPMSIAPYQVAIVPLAMHDEGVAGTAERIYDELRGNGVDVIIDDRDARPGVKLSDVELTGIPLRLAIGKRGLANGVVELTTRKTGETIEVPVAEALTRTTEAIRSA